VPQVGWPQIDPVKSDINEKVKPMGAILFVIIVKTLFLKINAIKLQTHITA
jgi:hypothetical protein